MCKHVQSPRGCAESDLAGALGRAPVLIKCSITGVIAVAVSLRWLRGSRVDPQQLYPQQL